MKEYIKPFIEDEEIEIEDICKISGVDQAGSADTDGDELDPSSYW